MPEQAQMDMPDDKPSDLFVRVLAIDKAIADLLVANEITTLEEVAYVPQAELEEIKGLSAELITSIRQRARSHLLRDVMGRS